MARRTVLWLERDARKIQHLVRAAEPFFLPPAVRLRARDYDVPGTTDDLDGVETQLLCGHGAEPVHAHVGTREGGAHALPACAAPANSAVYLWHCDLPGLLRRAQSARPFRGVFEPGPATLGSNARLISQLALPRDVCSTVFGTATGYSAASTTSRASRSEHVRQPARARVAEARPVAAGHGYAHGRCGGLVPVRVPRLALAQRRLQHLAAGVARQGGDRQELLWHLVARELRAAMRFEVRGTGLASPCRNTTKARSASPK